MGAAHFIRQIVSRVLSSRLSPLSVSPGFREAQKVVRINQEIAELEAQSKFDEARAVRDQALRTIDARFSTPLLRSRGFDLLRLGRMREALEAFEAGIRYLDERGLLFGVAAPDELYYGAALAAMRTGDVDSAREYYRKTTEIIARIQVEFPAGQKPGWWNEGLELLRGQLERARPKDRRAHGV
ncbi:MAG TPA: hypothetical protein VMD08_11795 [Candidatus Baltobacteraceae bacterium]|nr:hypothetical protein [Candidatus Baltobacteraceae bacterium]